MTDNQTEIEQEKVIGNLEAVFTEQRVQAEVRETLEVIVKSVNGFTSPELRYAYASRMASRIRGIDQDKFDSAVKQNGVTHFSIGDQVIRVEDILEPKDFKFER